MKKKILFLSILCLLFVTLSYTYSSFKNTIVANITANVKDWVFKVSVDNGTIKDGGYNLHLSGTSGSFNVNINTTGSKSGADYTIELIGDSSIKFYTDSSYTKLINNNIYSGSINSNTGSSVTLYYKSDTTINSDILIKTKGTIMETATMKNGYSDDSSANGGTEFWTKNYKPYIRTIDFGNDLSNLPSNCTEENLCWDISESPTQKKKVYGYLIDTGLKDSTDNTKPLYNLYIVSDALIFAPSDCTSIFSFYKYDNGRISNLTQINFNDNFNTSKATKMSVMFSSCLSLTSLDLRGFNTANVTNMYSMFGGCSSLISLDLSNINTANVTNMASMFSGCSSLTSLNLSGLNTSNVTDMNYMFSSCSSLKNLVLKNFNNEKVKDMSDMFSSCSSLINLDLSSFNTTNVTNMSSIFSECSSLTSLNLSNFNTANVTNMSYMFYNCSSLTSLDLSSFNTVNVATMGDMFSECTLLKNLVLNNFNTANLKYVNGMFYNCTSLTNLDLSSFNTAKVIDMGTMFSGCSSLTSLNLSNFNTANVTAMYDMFRGCSSLTSLNLSNFNTAKVDDMSKMFYQCSSLTSLDLSSFNGEKVTKTGNMFDSCSSLTSLDLRNFGMENVSDMSNMFSNCSSLTTTLNIKSSCYVWSCSNMFSGAATKSGSKVTINYIASASSLVDRMIATKSSNSNIVKGSQI